jgi:hypothetical protein
MTSSRRSGIILSAGILGFCALSAVEARVGRPVTPVSVAGVARRTTRRMVVATSVYVAALPPACTVVVIEGTTLYQSGTTYYQASGSQYVVVNVQ